MNERILSEPLSYPSLVHDIIFAIITMAPEEHPAEYLSGVVRRAYDVTPIAYLLQGLGYFTSDMQPTENWNQLMEAESHVRPDMLRTAFENAFRTWDGSSATEAIQTITDSRGRIDWLMQQHGLASRARARYAERLYRKALAALDAATSADALDKWAYLQAKRQSADALLMATPQGPTAIPQKAIRAVPRSHEHGSKGIELVFWLPDDADSSVYERIFQAADSTIFSKEGHWDPFRDVDPRQVRLNVVKSSDQGVLPQ